MPARPMRVVISSSSAIPRRRCTRTSSRIMRSRGSMSRSSRYTGAPPTTPRALACLTTVHLPILPTRLPTSVKMRRPPGPSSHPHRRVPLEGRPPRRQGDQGGGQERRTRGAQGDGPDARRQGDAGWHAGAGDDALKEALAQHEEVDPNDAGRPGAGGAIITIKGEIRRKLAKSPGGTIQAGALGQAALDRRCHHW